MFTHSNCTLCLCLSSFSVTSQQVTDLTQSEEYPAGTSVSISCTLDSAPASSSVRGLFLSATSIWPFMPLRFEIWFYSFSHHQRRWYWIQCDGMTRVVSMIKSKQKVIHCILVCFYGKSWKSLKKLVHRFSVHVITYVWKYHDWVEPIVGYSGHLCFIQFSHKPHTASDNEQTPCFRPYCQLLIMANLKMDQSQW